MNGVSTPGPSVITRLLETRERLPERRDYKVHQLPIPSIGNENWQDFFAEQQLRSLIQQIFSPGLANSCRHVLFCGVDTLSDTASVCVQTAFAMSRQLPGTICLAETGASDLEAKLGFNEKCIQWPQRAGRNGRGGERIAENLWLVKDDWMRGGGDSQTHSVFSLKERFRSLRNEFDYAVVHGPVVGMNSDAEFLAGLCDGVILIVDAHRTRRLVACRAKELLVAAHVKILGTILNQRTFPIPETLYRKL
jgi:hypothetical protein